MRVYLPAHFHKHCRNESRRNLEAPFEDGKRYARFEKIELPNPTAPQTTLKEALSARRSGRNFLSEPLPIEELASLLALALGSNRDGSFSKEAGKYRSYPSGGARHPLEFYLDARNVSSLERGLYHYHPEEHALYRLPPPERSLVEYEYLSYDWSRDAGAVLILSALWRRSSAKYFDFSYPVVLLEAGHAAQNALLCAAAVELKACPLAGFRDDILAKLLDVDPLEETPLYVIALGK